MKRTLYARYNRTRNPQYQTSTKIFEVEGKRYVEKCALTEEAIGHIQSMSDKYALCLKLYKNIQPLKGDVQDNKICFSFLDGYSVKNILDGMKDDLNALLKKIEECMNDIFSYRDDVLCDFSYTSGYEAIFGRYVEEGCKALAFGDIDIIFDNVIYDRDTWYSIDYEWFFDFPIPLDYIKYRMLYRYYYSEHDYFTDKISESEFLKHFGFTELQCQQFEKCELAFQYYVYGEKCKYVYTERYKKSSVDFYRLLEQYGNVNTALEENQRRIEELELTVQHEKNIRNEEIVKRDSEIAQKDSEIAQKNSEIAQKDSEILLKNEEISKRDAIIADKERHIVNITNDMENYKNAYNQIINSKSWKLTTPVRKIMNVPGCIKQFGWKYTIRYALTGKTNVVDRQNTYLEPKQYDIEYLQKQRDTQFSFSPKFSILVPLYNTPETFLREMLESVIEQTYVNWELCLADGSDKEHAYVKKVCMSYGDKRIRYKKLNSNGGISENTNACIEMATGEYIGLFDHDDLLDITLFYELVNKLNQDSGIDIMYTDEDKVITDVHGNKRYAEPHFKSDFNLDLFRTNNYICHFFMARREIVDKVNGFRREYDGSQDFDFIFRCVEHAQKIVHIPKVLYHWRIHENSTAANPQSKMYCYEAGKKAIEDHLQREHIKASVEMSEHLGFYRVKYELQERSKISIIIPNKDEKDTLKKCIDSILNKSTYDNYEIIVVENNSVTTEIFDYYEELKEKGIKVVTWEYEFNYSKINNYGVKFATGDYYLLLNNDVEVITPNWLEEMLSNCQRKEVGIVGAKLLYPDNTVQHDGVIIGLGGVAGHAFCGIPANDPGYFGRAFIQQNLNAVTAACLMVSKEVFEKVGGLEEKLQVAFNDVDFCLKVRTKGYLIVLNPNVQLYHYESKSRGMEDTPEKKKRFEGEVNFMLDKWSDILENGDEYYNQNLSLVVPYQVK